MAVREAGRCPPASWTPPPWLLPHQPAAARTVASALGAYGVALLCDATGLGKTWTALAVATRYRRPVAIVPAILREQWRRTGERVGVNLRVISHESLSREATVPTADLLIVDEAHRFRNPDTARYDRLARGVRTARLLLITATPVVNHANDLAAILRLALPRAPRDLSPLLVARTVVEAGVAGMPAVAHRHWTTGCDHADLVAASGELTFPSFGPVGRALLHRHLLYRLGSSLAAAAETLRRHDRYLERLAGQSITRAAFRRLVDGDDPQIEMLFDPVTPAAGEVEDERRRIRRLRAMLHGRPDRKIGALVALLRRQPTRTVVFTGATVTARAIADALGWDRVALVTGRGARIASGPVSVATALDGFAPEARHTRAHRAARADVLVATDLVSEGLDLQDAARVVHFDLPWTPQRLLQRLGRVARLGTHHTRVEVVWFPPPPTLDIPRRLSRKETALRDVLTRKELRVEHNAVATRRLVRSLLRTARAAAHTRDTRLLGALDAVLDRLRSGLVVGAERELGALLSEPPTGAGAEEWLARWARGED